MTKTVIGLTYAWFASLSPVRCSLDITIFIHHYIFIFNSSLVEVYLQTMLEFNLQENFMLKPLTIGISDTKN